MGRNRCQSHFPTQLAWWDGGWAMAHAIGSGNGAPGFSSGAMSAGTLL